MAAFGLWDALAGSLVAIIAVMTLNGWVQGMGWPPCGKTMVHWFSLKERGLTVSTWNTAHNVGGALVANLALLGVVLFGDWGAKFYFNALVAAAIAIGGLLPARGHAAVARTAAGREVEERLSGGLQRSARGDAAVPRDLPEVRAARTSACGRSRSRTRSPISCATAS